MYSELKLWSRDGEGTDRLQTLQEKNVGAIYLANVASPFELRDDEGEVAGELRSTGIYVKEDGGAGTIQQVDLLDSQEE